MSAKQVAAEAAAALVEPGMRLGLGTGTTVEHLLVAIAARGIEVTGVPTSEATAVRCRELGIGLLDPNEVERLDLAIDGADELTRELVLTKGGGGALVREKVVASMAERVVIIATPDKVVERLGATFPLPIEVVPFAVTYAARRLEREHGLEVEVRRRNGAEARTDNGNAILDARAPGGIEDPAALDLVVSSMPGVIDTGLFVDLADLAILGSADGTTRTIERAIERG
jgi:ribose 5-phosphate isomerase A